MAVIDHIHAPHTGILRRIGKTLADMLRSFQEARSKSCEYQYYANLSDAELAERGLRRDEIVFHVFRNTYL